MKKHIQLAAFIFEKATEINASLHDVHASLVIALAEYETKLGAMAGGCTEQLQHATDCALSEARALASANLQHGKN